LPDGTKVWLNENSVFQYPVEFVGKERRVKLNGEVYFDVARDEKKNFIIEMDEAKVSVLGTAFNLKAFKGDTIIVLTVEEGRVRLQPTQSPRAAVVNVGERGIYKTKAGQLQLLPINDENTIFWKNKTLTFSDRRLIEALVTIRRELKIGVELEDKYMEECRLTGRFPNATPQSVLQQIADTFKMELVEISEGKFELKGGDCD